LVPDVRPRPTEAFFDKIAMSAFVGSPLEMALRDCRLEAFAIVGVAMEIGIEPTVRHGIDLGFLPVVVTDACGAGDLEAAERSRETLRFAGGSLEKIKLHDVLGFGVRLSARCRPTTGTTSAARLSTRRASLGLGDYPPT
jgi:nicotinamidase-related amidase